MALQRENTSGGRTVKYSIRLSEDERAALEKQANSHGEKVSRMIMRKTLGTDDNDQAKLWRTELLGLRRQVSEQGCTPELDAAILDLLRRIAG